MNELLTTLFVYACIFGAPAALVINVLLDQIGGGDKDE